MCIREGEWGRALSYLENLSSNELTPRLENNKTLKLLMVLVLVLVLMLVVDAGVGVGIW